MSKEELLNWWSHTPQDGPPADRGDPSLYEYRSSKGMWYCRLCWKYANEAHVYYCRHAKNVRGHVYVTSPAPPALPAPPAPRSATAKDRAIAIKA